MKEKLINFIKICNFHALKNTVKNVQTTDRENIHNTHI